MMKLNKKITISILFILISLVCVAQTATDIPPPSPERAPPLPGLPIDSGIYIILTIGLVYGIVRITRNLKPKA